MNLATCKLYAHSLQRFIIENYLGKTFTLKNCEKDNKQLDSKHETCSHNNIGIIIGPICTCICMKSV